MKNSWCAALTLLLCAVSARAQVPQADDPLALTLPNGKVVHFQTSEQKSKFEAGLERSRLASASSSAAPVMPTGPAFSVVAPQAGAANPADGRLDFTPAEGIGAGIPSNAGPMFTAKYYLATPESWVGKKVTISIANIVQQTNVKEGLMQLAAGTWNNTGANHSKDGDGKMIVFAKPEAAGRLMQACGDKPQDNGAGQYKTTMIQGLFGRIVAAPSKSKKDKGKTQTGYCLYVEK